MKTLMGSYRSERSRKNKSRLSGSGIEDVYNSKWFAYKYFDFLSDKDNPRETMDREVVESSEEQLEVQVSTETTSVSPAATTSVATEQQESQNTTFRAPGSRRMQRTATKRKAAEQDVDSQMINEALKIIQSSANSSNDPYFTYALNLANELRKYDPTTLAHVKRAFANILFDADMGVYSTPSPYSSGTTFRTPTPYTSPTESSSTSHDSSRDSPPLISNTFPTSSDTSEHNVPATTIESILLNI
ncbi:unnamed protein product [Acanthoscelides obtectus]|uniref:BESS domain-containing protein n=1 Tax=Acanthoscelides obtectus TaxID=200917 RepID=A0A9P0M661_ACAOB|nr:unnamed protein product [Acanthoscelides obtectus]CAK1687979.1 hypothetical protein AOBTE_LOCUS36492 [Acanthoscelides obtectus]